MVGAHPGVERTVAQIDREIKESFPNVQRVFIEAEARRTRAGH